MDKKPGQILVISRREIESLLPLPELIEGIKRAYMLQAARRDVDPKRAVSPLDNGSIVINFPGALAGYDVYTVKTNTKMPSNHLIGLPFVVGAILLLDRANGLPLAVFESSLITAMRTCAAGAVGAATLARHDAGKVAVIGAGAQCLWQLRALKVVGHLSEARIYDIIPDRANILAEALTDELELPVRACNSVAETVTEADIIIAATQSVEPIITTDLIRPGMHVNAFGADEPGKVELSSGVLARSLIVVDDRNLALSDGTLNVAFSNGEIDTGAIHAEIGEVLLEKRAGRDSDEQITVFGSVGLAFQDLVACRMIYDKAVSSGFGTWVDLI